MSRETTQISFDKWMIEIIQSVHYSNNENMDKAYQRLLKPVEIPIESIVDSNGRLKESNNVINTTPKRKVFKIFRNPFKK